MAKVMVKCLYCGKQFDRISEPNVKIGRRYAHKACYEAQDDETIKTEKDKNDFYSKQAESYIKMYDFTYSGMLKSLKWFYEVKHNDKDSSNGKIGIIPYIYKDAYDYYYNLYLAQQRNKDITNYRLETKEVVIASPHVFITPPKLFDLGDED